MSRNDAEAQASSILNWLIETPFEQCYPITRNFKHLTAKANLYAARHRSLSLLYVGKTRYTRERFRGGHKAFLWSWLDNYQVHDVRLLVYPLSFTEVKKLSSELEAIIIATAKPPYNARYSARDS